jgi:hypothetical protein
MVSTATPPAPQNTASRAGEIRLPATTSTLTASPGTNAITPPKSAPHSGSPSSAIAVSPSASTTASAHARAWPPPRLISHCATPTEVSSVEVANTEKAMLPRP